MTGRIKSSRREYRSTEVNYGSANIAIGKWTSSGKKGKGLSKRRGEPNRGGEVSFRHGGGVSYVKVRTSSMIRKREKEVRNEIRRRIKSRRNEAAAAAAVVEGEEEEEETAAEGAEEEAEAEAEEAAEEQEEDGREETCSLNHGGSTFRST